MTRFVALIPDLHVPFEHRRAVTNVLQWLSDRQPDEVVIVGEVVAGISASNWGVAMTRFFEPLRTAYDGPVRMLEIAPGRFGPDTRRDLGCLDIALLPDLYGIAPGWLSTHGHPRRVLQLAGSTALGAAKHFGKNVAMGDTMRLGIINDSSSVGGKVTRSLTGFEVGHLRDMKRSDHPARGNAQLGIGLLTVDDNGHVRPDAIEIDHRGVLRVEQRGTLRNDHVPSA